MIYFARAADDAIKIGYSANVPDRVAALQIGSPGIIKVLAVMPGHKEGEAALHSMFQAHRLHGEWFKPVPALLTMIEQIKAEYPQDCQADELPEAVLAEKTPKGADETLRNFTLLLREAYGTGPKAVRTLAESVGCSQRTAQNWLDGKNLPSGLQICRLVAVSDLMLGWLLYETNYGSGDYLKKRCAIGNAEKEIALAKADLAQMRGQLIAAE